MGYWVIKKILFYLIVSINSSLSYNDKYRIRNNSKSSGRKPTFTISSLTDGLLLIS